MPGPRPKFDPSRPLVAAREFTFMGKAFKPGQPFNPEGASDRLRARQYEARAVNFGEGEAAADAADADPVQMTGPKGGRYTITAPWLDEPETVRGKVNAEKRLAEIREEGEPDSHHGYTLTKGENGWWKITKDGVEPTGDADAPSLNVQGEDNARETAAQLRAGETPSDTALPDEWTAGTSSDVQPDGGATEETTVDDTNKENDLNERKPEDGDKPNEPGTNQPNGAEVINDHKVAEGETGDDGDADGEGEGSTRPVGP